MLESSEKLNFLEIYISVMADHREIPMTPNPVYGEVISATHAEEEASNVSHEAINSRKTCRKYNTKNVMFYILLPSFLVVLLCLVVALLVVTVAPSQPVPSSCADIVEFSPLSVSGYYVVRSSSGSLVQVYCDMGVVCDGSRGWMRVVVSDYYQSSSVRNPSICRTVESLSTNGVTYSHVCGQLVAYTDISIQNHSGWCRVPPFNAQASVDDSYVAGFSITHGRPRQHIWSLASSYEKETGAQGLMEVKIFQSLLARITFQGAVISTILIVNSCLLHGSSLIYQSL